METIGAFLGGEQHVAAHFLGGQLRLAPHITVEFGIARNQSADELGYRKANPVHADDFAAKRLLEQRRVHRNGCDALHDGIGIAGKFGRIQKGFPNQLLQVLRRILGGTVPAESLGVVGHINQWQHVMRGQSPGNALHPTIHQTGIVQTGLERMRLTVAGRATEHRIALMTAAQPDIVKKITPQTYALARKPVVVRDIGLARKIIRLFQIEIRRLEDVFGLPLAAGGKGYDPA